MSTRRTYPTDIELPRANNAADLPLFAPPAARSSDPATSKDAAASMEAGAAHHRAQIMAALAQGDLTGDELNRLYHWPAATANRRLTELVRAGLIHATDRTRPTRAGRQAAVYTLGAAAINPEPIAPIIDRVMADMVSRREAR